MTYGVLPSGFRAKPLADTLADLEDANADPSIFGNDVVQTPQSPLGQLNGVRALAITSLWELASSIYAANDPDQTEGINLDRLSRLRLISRLDGEEDADLAKAITNVGVPRLREADLARAVKTATGVTWSRVYSNETGAVDDNGLPAACVTFAVLGGDDAELASLAQRYITAGLTQFGNVSSEITVGGYCRTMRFTRPAEIPLTLSIDISKTRGNDDCPPPSNAAIAEVLAAHFTGDNRPRNGVTLTDHIIRNALCSLPGVEVKTVQAAKNDDALSSLPMVFPFSEIPTTDISLITVTEL